ncbi:MAG: pyridoxine 5'-phosphate synthase [Alloprevotella sp.]|nr:pyridoxine 5'-phosphate synthase [Alloprevotella sp.]
MTKLSVNINKIATLRNARGGNNPDVLRVAKDCEIFGAQGITVHPRPDERHIRYADVRMLASELTTEFNIEGYPSEEFCRLVCEVAPTQVTLVPDKPGQLTSCFGWDTKRHEAFLSDVTARFHEYGIRVSIFIDAEHTAAEYAKRSGADRVELYTEPYASGYAEDCEAAVRPFVETAAFVQELGMGLNAGHDLSLHNLAYLHSRIPWLDEVSIGHALVCDALYLGLHETIRQYLACLQ